MTGTLLTVRRWSRAMARALGRATCDVVHAPEYCVALPATPHDAWRPARILAFLDRERLLDRRRLHRAPLAGLRELRAVHTLDYLESLERPEGTTRVFGAPVPDRLAQDVIAAQRRMAGGTTLAARLALDRRAVAIHVGGGLHHARADRGAGFCLINDVAVAIAALRAAGFAGRVAVVDLDLHDGDGTRSLFAADPSVHTYSVHNRDWDSTEAVESTAIALGTGVEDERYLATVRESLPPLFDRFAPELVFYLAGADPAEDDALGDWQITAAGLSARDRLVFDEIRRRRLPTVALLAGGYGHHAWRHAARSFSALLGGGGEVEPPSTSELVMAQYRELAGRLEPGELSGRGDDLLSAEDINEIFGQSSTPSSRFLGYYTPSGIEVSLERLGYLEDLRRLGFESPRVELDLGGSGGDTLRIFNGEGRAELLVELRARRERRAMPGFELLWVEWLLLQNPRAHFPPGRPPLPGQAHPGLGRLRETMAALVLICDRLKLDGIGVTASHYHPAAQSIGELRFLDPAHEGLFRSLAAVVEGLPIPRACRAIEEEGLVDSATNHVFHWRPVPMIFPVSERLRDWFDRDAYRAGAAEPGPGFELRADR